VRRNVANPFALERSFRVDVDQITKELNERGLDEEFNEHDKRHS